MDRRPARDCAYSKLLGGLKLTCEVDAGSLLPLLNARLRLNDLIALVEIFLIRHIVAGLMIPAAANQQLFSLQFLSAQNFALTFENGFQSVRLVCLLLRLDI